MFKTSRSYKLILLVDEEYPSPSVIRLYEGLFLFFMCLVWFVKTICLTASVKKKHCYLGIHMSTLITIKCNRDCSSFREPICIGKSCKIFCYPLKIGKLAFYEYIGPYRLGVSTELRYGFTPSLMEFSPHRLILFLIHALRSLRSRKIKCSYVIQPDSLVLIR